MVAQLAGSLVLLIVAGLFVRSLGKAQQLYLGFDPYHVLISLWTLKVGYDQTRGEEFFRQVDQRIRAIPGVVSWPKLLSLPWA